MVLRALQKFTLYDNIMKHLQFKCHLHNILFHQKTFEWQKWRNMLFDRWASTVCYCILNNLSFLPHAFI